MPTRGSRPTNSSRLAEPEAGPSPTAGVGLVRLRFDLAYDGSDFHGWAAQPGVRSVQETVEQALSLVFRTQPPPSLTVAGRTDAGVHARGQVAHADVAGATWEAVAGRALPRLNRVLPADVRLHAIRLAPAGFDARFSALSRRYSYRVSDSVA